MDFAPFAKEKNKLKYVQKAKNMIKYYIFNCRRENYD